MCKNPLVTVIMSCYNHEKYVAEAIESILNQTYRDFYFYVADDCSPDGSVNEILKYEDKIDEIHLFDTNRGTRVDFLLNCVQTEYVAIINSDDVWDKEKLEKQVAFMSAHKECKACFTWCKVQNKYEDTMAAVSPDLFRAKNKARWEWMKSFFCSGNCLAMPTVFVYTDVFKKLFVSEVQAFWQNPDFYMWVKLIQESEIHVIEEDLVCFRFHKEGTNVSLPSVENIIRSECEEIFMWYKVIKYMNDQFFVNAFKDMFVDKNARTETEICCEKFFVLLQARQQELRHAAIWYYYDIYERQDVVKVFEEKYHFRAKDFCKMEMDLGYIRRMRELAKWKNS